MLHCFQSRRVVFQTRDVYRKQFKHAATDYMYTVTDWNHMDINTWGDLMMPGAQEFLLQQSSRCQAYAIKYIIGEFETREPDTEKGCWYPSPNTVSILFDTSKLPYCSGLNQSVFPVDPTMVFEPAPFGCWNEELTQDPVMENVRLLKEGEVTNDYIAINGPWQSNEKARFNAIQFGTNPVTNYSLDVERPWKIKKMLKTNHVLTLKDDFDPNEITRGVEGRDLVHQRKKKVLSTLAGEIHLTPHWESTDPILLRTPDHVDFPNGLRYNCALVPNSPQILIKSDPGWSPDLIIQKSVEGWIRVELLIKYQMKYPKSQWNITEGSTKPDGEDLTKVKTLFPHTEGMSRTVAIVKGKLVDKCELTHMDTSMEVQAAGSSGQAPTPTCQASTSGEPKLYPQMKKESS
ncbi:uncharacterized protein [Scyliorhinus torazame]|uniref:uncharacterized protein n=1 Tax=Scyliorhinus torazame TaxID=75743 RepID=UPI003B5AB37D